MKSIVFKKIFLTETDKTAIDNAFSVLRAFAKELDRIDEPVLCDEFIEHMCKLEAVLRNAKHMGIVETIEDCQF